MVPGWETTYSQGSCIGGWDLSDIGSLMGKVAENFAERYGQRDEIIAKFNRQTIKCVETDFTIPDYNFPLSGFTSYNKDEVLVSESRIDGSLRQLHETSLVHEMHHVLIHATDPLFEQIKVINGKVHHIAPDYMGCVWEGEFHDPPCTALVVEVNKELEDEGL